MRLLILVTALLSATSTAFANEENGLMNAFSSVVMIRGYNINGGLAYGSGVVVGQNQVITNCHVFRSTKEPWVAHGEDAYPITSVKADVWHDLCLVTTVALPFKPAILGKTSDLKVGQEVAGIGHSNGSPAPLTSSGYIQGLFDDQPGKVIRTSAKFRMGASGSGLFDMEGKLVGINTFKTAGRGNSIFFALPVEWVEELQKKTEIATLPITGKALWEEDEDKKPYYMQAAVPESQEDWPKLAKVSDKWTQAEPKSPYAWYSLAIALDNLDKDDLAEKAYRQVTLLDHNNYEALVHLGVIAKNRGDQAEMHKIQVTLNGIDPALGEEYSQLLECNKSC
jgi:serine protease Do